jgi:flagellar hook-length control protein FliK
LTPEIRQDASPKNVSSDTDLLNAERHNPPFDLKTSALLAEKGAAPYNTANFAVPLEKSSALPHEPLPPEPLPQGQTVLHQASTPGALSQNAQTPAAGSGLQTPLFNPEWAQEFGEKIVWMAKNDQQQAHLSLNPAHLGPLRITLNLEADKAFATFTASTPEARQAIEEALPRLREMLSGAGIFLGDAQVGAQSREEARFSHAQYGESHPGNAGDTAILEDGPLSERAMMSARQKEGLVDLFA